MFPRFDFVQPTHVTHAKKNTCDLFDAEMSHVAFGTMKTMSHSL